jgi:hypothetical protein
MAGGLEREPGRRPPGIAPAARTPPGASKSRLPPPRVPQLKRDPALERIAEEIASHNRAFSDTLAAAKHYRSVSTLPNREKFYQNCLVSLRYRRIEIARLIKIYRELGG